MAQPNGSNVIEKHLEKGVLAVCAVLFIYGLFHWVFSSPRSMDGRPLKSVDEQILEKARQADEAAKRAHEEIPPLPDYDGAVKELRETRFAKRWGDLASIGTPGRELSAGEGVIPELPRVTLSSLMPLPGPIKIEVQPRLELPKSGEELKDVRIAHGVLLYPWEALKASWERQLRDTTVPVQFVVFDVEVQVQEKLPDGSWSKEQPLKAESIPLEQEELQKLSAIRQQICSFDGSNDQEVRQAVDALGSEWQQRILTPLYWQIWDSKAKQWADWKRGLVEALVGQIVPQETVPETPATPVGPTEEVQVPSLTDQLQSGKVLCWFHQAGLSEMKVYRYRARLELVNPLLTHVDKVKDPSTDATQPTIKTEWSEWCREVAVPKSTVFFLTGDNPGAAEARVTVFTRSLGEPVKHDFYVKVGDPIGRKASVEVMHPVQGAMTQQMTDFTTGVVVVDLDFNKNLVKNNLPLRTTEMLYLDEKGQLRTQNRAADEESPQYRQWLEASKPPAAIGPR